MTVFSKDNRISRIGRMPVPVELWHKNHWSTLAYLEVCEVDCHGVVDWDHISVSERNWGGFYEARSAMAKGGFGKDAADYGLPVRTDPGKAMLYQDHCEVDAIMDMVDAGLVEIVTPPVEGGFYLKPDGSRFAKAGSPDPADELDDMELLPYSAFRLTDEGHRIAGALRRHKVRGKAYAAFTLEDAE
jgi:hypothetical protein